MRIIVFVFLMLMLLSCNRKLEVEEDRKVECGCTGEVPPLPPPIPGELIDIESMIFTHFGENVNFRVALICDKSIFYDQSSLQTYKVKANNGNSADSFYFALSSADEYLYSRQIKLVKNKTHFDIGYDKDGSFNTIYKVYLGDTFNANRIYMASPERFKIDEEIRKESLKIQKETSS